MECLYVVLLRVVYLLACLRHTNGLIYNKEADVHFMLVGGSIEEECPGQKNSIVSEISRSTIDTINSASDGIKFGLQIIEGHGHIETARLHVEAEVSSQSSNTGICPPRNETEMGFTNSTFIGVITREMLLENTLTDLSTASIPVIYIGEPNLGTADMPNNIFNAGVSLRTRAEAIAKLITELNCDYTTVVYGSDETSRGLKILLEVELKKSSVCVDSFIEVSRKPTGAEIVQRVIGDTKPRVVILIAMDLYDAVNLEHSGNDALSWIVSTFSAISVTRNQGDHVYVVNRHQSSGSQVLQGSQLISTLYLGAEAVKNVVKRKCGNEIASCSNIQRSVLTELNSLVVNYQRNVSGFSYQGDLWFNNDNQLTFSPELPAFSLLYNEKITADYNISGRWILPEAVTNVTKRYWCTDEVCRKNCSEKVQPKNYIYLPGEVIIIVTMPIHDRHTEHPNPFTCVDFNRTNALRSEAAIFARDRLNNIFKEEGLHIGLLIVDTCFSTVRTQKLLIDILYGTTDYCDEDDNCLDRSKIVGLVGDYSSHISVAIQQILKAANLIQVAYGASTSILDDKKVYTNFLRAQPSYTKMAANVHQLLSRINSTASGKAAINSYVLIYTNSEYGTNGAQDLKMEFEKASLCLLYERQLDYRNNDTNDYDEIWTELAKKGTDASLIILYVGEEQAFQRLLDRLIISEVIGEDWRSWWIESGSIFLLTEIFEDKPEIRKDYGEVLRGSLIVSISPIFEVPGFRRYLRNLRTEREDIVNPWFRRLYQEERSCKVRGSFISPAYSPCPTDRGYAADNDYTVETYAVLTVESLYAFVYGLNETVHTVCNGNYNCPILYERNATLAQILREKTGKIKIPASDDDTIPQLQTLYPFNSNYDGRSDAIFFNIQFYKDYNKSVQYVPVFRATSNHDADTHDTLVKLKGDIEFYKDEGYHGLQRLDTFDGIVCGKDECPFFCENNTGKTTPLVGPPSSLRNISIALGASLAILFVILIIMIFLWRFKSFNTVSKESANSESINITVIESDEAGKHIGDDNPAFDPDLEGPSPRVSTTVSPMSSTNIYASVNDADHPTTAESEAPPNIPCDDSIPPHSYQDDPLPSTNKPSISDKSNESSADLNLNLNSNLDVYLNATFSRTSDRNSNLNPPRSTFETYRLSHVSVNPLQGPSITTQDASSNNGSTSNALSGSDTTKEEDKKEEEVEVESEDENMEKAKEGSDKEMNNEVDEDCSGEVTRAGNDVKPKPVPKPRPSKSQNSNSETQATPTHEKCLVGAYSNNSNQSS